jgi:S1-C subfamily serine protease
MFKSLVGVLVATLAFLIMLGTVASPQPPPPQASPSATVTGPPREVSAVIEKRLEALERESLDLKQKLIKPPKDRWDKLAAISTLISGIVVALIGFYATSVYNRRQKEAEDHRKDQELTISQVQTVEKFIPHLSSANEAIKAAALSTIAALGNDELAVKLARIFGGSGSTIALASIAATARPSTVAAAHRALGDLLEYLKSRVVALLDSGTRRASGFVISESGLIVTTAHAVDGLLADRLRVQLPNGQLQAVKQVVVDHERDLALLSTQFSGPLATLEFSDLTLEQGAHVIALFQAQNGDLVTRVGYVSTLLVRHLVQFGSVERWVANRIGTSLDSEPGNSGAPVLDQQGRLVGIVESTDQQTTYLIPAWEIQSFVDAHVISA